MVTRAGGRDEEETEGFAARAREKVSKSSKNPDRQGDKKKKIK